MTNERLIMPEYGRNVQRMVEHCMQLPDRMDRNRCAAAIIRTMALLHPELDNPEKQHTFYDHLAMMSDFQLDIDFPYGIPESEDLKLVPCHLQYSNPSFPFRHYGKVIQAMVNQACCEEDIQKRHALTNIIANRLKYTYLLWNKDQVDAEQIKHDIELMSRGLLTCDFPEFQLLHSWQLISKNDKTSAKKKKKK